MPEPLTRDDFVRTFGRTPDAGVQLLRAGSIVVPCDCQIPDCHTRHCRGWSLVRLEELHLGYSRLTPEQIDEATDHRDTYLAALDQTQTALAAVGPILNPLCAVEKHGACHGDAWDNVEDESADCECSCHGGS